MNTSPTIGKLADALAQGETSMNAMVDFTKMRLGSKPISKNKPITRCKKCGRKGEWGAWAPPNGKQVHTWTHAGKYVRVAGITFFEVNDQCMMTEDDK